MKKLLLVIIVTSIFLIVNNSIIHAQGYVLPWQSPQFFGQYGQSWRVQPFMPGYFGSYNPIPFSGGNFGNTSPFTSWAPWIGPSFSYIPPGLSQWSTAGGWSGAQPTVMTAISPPPYGPPLEHPGSLPWLKEPREASANEWPYPRITFASHDFIQWIGRDGEQGYALAGTPQYYNMLSEQSDNLKQRWEQMGW